MKDNFENTDVVILCGGKGERLQSVVSDRPKVLADINGKPFLEILIDNLKRFGFKRFILSVGYKKEAIIDYFKDKEDIVFSEEETALGTGGGLKKAKGLVKSSPFMAMNGDCFCDLEFDKLLEFHKQKNALLSIALVKTLEPRDYGTVALGLEDEIKSFREKISGSQTSLVNAGIYMMNKEIFSLMPAEKAFSLEYDLFPKLENSFGYVSNSKIYDIGTPVRYNKAKEVFKRGDR